MQNGADFYQRFEQESDSGLLCSSRTVYQNVYPTVSQSVFLCPVAGGVRALCGAVFAGKRA